MKSKQTPFEVLLESTCCCYSKDIINNLPKIDDFPSYITNLDNKVICDHLKLIDNNSNVFFKSVTLRLIAICELRNARDLGIKVDVKKLWNLIAESILILPINAIISSIGSQGFLSIPLFKYEVDKGEIDFIRLHIWDNSLSKYFQFETYENFSIHSHSFYAESWIVYGSIINERFKVEISDVPSGFSLFKIEYNKTLNELNRHTSSANNTNRFVTISKTSHEKYEVDGNYVVKEGDFHKSSSEGDSGLSATLFSFCAHKGKVDHSYVIGPSHLMTSEINRKIQIDPTDLINRINEKLI